MVLADSNVHRRGDDHMRIELHCNLRCHMTNAAPVVLHGEVFQMLFRGRDGDDAAFQFASLHPFAKLSAGVLCEQDFVFARECHAGFH